MTVLRWCVTVAALMLAVGCHRGGGPSPEFERARDRFFVLQNADPMGVFANPEVKTLLPAIEGVPAGSVEKPAADELAKTIRAGIADLEKTLADRAKSVEEAGRPVAFVPAAGGGSPTPAPTPGASPVAKVDAGPPSEPGPAVGTTTGTLSSGFGGCFSKTGAYTDDKGAVGETYAMTGGATCATRFPAQANVILLVQSDKVSSVVPKSAVTSASSFTMGSSTEQKGTPPPAAVPAPMVAPAPAPSAAPVLPTPADDQITRPPVDPNVNPDAINK